MGSAELILECFHCHNTTGHFLLCEAPSTNTAYSMDNPPETEEIECTYYLTKCKTCGGISLYYDDEYDIHTGYLTEAHLCYPRIDRPSEDIPEIILQTFNEAIKVEHVSLNAFAMLVRRTLELLCQEKKALGKNLKEQIDDLALKNIIPLTLAEIGHALRVLGNKGAHVSEYQLDIEEIRSMKNFLNAMLEYVYVAPAKLLRLKQSMETKMNKKDHESKM